PTRGAWIEFEQNNKDFLYAKLDRSKKIPLTKLQSTPPFSLRHSFGKPGRVDVAKAYALPILAPWQVCGYCIFIASPSSKGQHFIMAMPNFPKDAPVFPRPQFWEAATGGRGQGLCLADFGSRASLWSLSFYCFPIIQAARLHNGHAQFPKARPRFSLGTVLASHDGWAWPRL
ncbi:MAG: hypothetical protein Q8759_02660, partial [Pigeon pea little leaf phytoplasma]|nr:hypothetical protein [Pigeon pea little leaf phytoplasma]